MSNNLDATLRAVPIVGENQDVQVDFCSSEDEYVFGGY